ncbi:MAG: pseudaminic acid synthase [Myxococcota bacterium]
MSVIDNAYLNIHGRKIGPGEPAYIIAELSANHNQDFDQAVELMHLAKEAGADAIKLQTYTPDTITIECNNEHFRLGSGTIWDGETLHQLYGRAYTPWKWQPELKRVGDDLGVHVFSSPFDETAVDFLEAMGVGAYKIASFELVHLPLIRYVARTGKPIIMSTGMATLAEIDEAVSAARTAGAKEIALLQCSSAYPAPPSSIHLRNIPHLAQAFSVVTGLSDHTLGVAVPIASVAQGAHIIEKHFTKSRAVEGPDSKFSLEPDEFKLMVESVRIAEESLGSIEYRLTEEERPGLVFRRSVFVVEDVRAGEPLTASNLRVIRPGYGLHSRHYEGVIGRTATRDLKRGTPLDWSMVG